MTAHRQDWIVGAFKWTLAPFVDRWHGLSLDRLLAVFCAVLVGHEVFVFRHMLTGIDYAVLVSAMAASFGRKVFMAWIERNSVGVVGTVAVSEETVHTITEIIDRRKQGDDIYEPTP